MGNIEIILSFIFAMSLLSIPILLILKHGGRKPDKRIDVLEKRVSDLELKYQEKTNEVMELRSDLKFLQRLLEDKSERR